MSAFMRVCVTQPKQRLHVSARENEQIIKWIYYMTAEMHISAKVSIRSIPFVCQCDDRGSRCKSRGILLNKNQNTMNDGK